MESNYYIKTTNGDYSDVPDILSEEETDYIQKLIDEAFSDALPDEYYY